MGITVAIILLGLNAVLLTVIAGVVGRWLPRLTRHLMPPVAAPEPRLLSPGPDPIAPGEVARAVTEQAEHEVRRSKTYTEHHRRQAIAQRVEQDRHRRGRQIPANVQEQVHRLLK